MVKVITHYIPKSAARPCRKLTRFSGVTIHETGNRSKGANAAAHDRYLHVNGGMNKQVSYHLVVDDKEAYNLIPYNEIAWHAGDGGSGKGNCQTVAIEICVNPETDLVKARTNAAFLTAMLLKDYGFKNVVDGTKDKTNGNVFQHNSFMNKNCPEIIRNNGLWDSFINEVKSFMGEDHNITVPNNAVSVGDKVYIKGNQYATGQTISLWAKKVTHTVSKVDGDKALLGANGGINSWVYIKDLEVV